MSTKKTSIKSNSTELLERTNKISINLNAESINKGYINKMNITEKSFKLKNKNITDSILIIEDEIKNKVDSEDKIAEIITYKDSSIKSLKSSSKSINLNKSLNDSYEIIQNTTDNKIFEEFLTVGIHDNIFECIPDEVDEMELNPKITYNYPNKLKEKELKFNTMFLKNVCFQNGVKVKRIYILNERDLEINLLQKNLYTKPNSEFCLVQQINPEEINRYFIYGIKFEDVHLELYDDSNEVKVKENNGKKSSNKSTKKIVAYIYEKTYLIISFNSYCKLFEEIFHCFLSSKKLNLLELISNLDLSSNHNLNNTKTNIQAISTFINNNKESINNNIDLLLEKLYNHSSLYESSEVYINLKTTSLKYNHPNMNNMPFLATDFLSEKMFTYPFNTKQIYWIIINLLLEQSFIFISDEIEILTTMVLGFIYLIQPFKWPYILIPNLPRELLEILDSPVPFVIGLLGTKEDYIEYLNGAFENNTNVIIYKKSYIKPDILKGKNFDYNYFNKLENNSNKEIGNNTSTTNTTNITNLSLDESINTTSISNNNKSQPKTNKFSSSSSYNFNFNPGNSLNPGILNPLDPPINLKAPLNKHHCNKFVNMGDFTYSYNNELNFNNMPSFMELEKIIEENLSKIKVLIKSKEQQFNKYKNYTSIIYKNIYDNIKYSLCTHIESLVEDINSNRLKNIQINKDNKTNKNNTDRKEVFFLDDAIKSNYMKMVYEEDMIFAVDFVNTQLFASYYEDLIDIVIKVEV